MKVIYRYVSICNQKENTRYLVIGETVMKRNRRKFLCLENCKTSETRWLEICPYCGTYRVMIREDILQGAEGSPRWIICKQYGGTILIEDKDF